MASRPTDLELPFGRGRQFLSGANGAVDRWSGVGEGTARHASRVARPFALGNVQLVGMTLENCRKLSTRAGIPIEPSVPADDIILNTAGISVSTTGSGFSALGAHRRYIASGNSNGCLQGFYGQCGFSNLILEGPRFVRFDMSVAKKIRFTERTNLELRVEFLNALNNINFLVGGSAAVDDGKLTATNLGLQTPNYSAATFGRITAAYQDISTTNDPGGRPIQFVLRFNF